MEKIIVVGTGDYYHRFLAPCLQMMQQQGLIEVLATVDIQARIFPEIDYFKNVEHRIRAPSQKLSDLISDLKNQKPIVILGHSNELHLPDAQNLISNDFRVMIEKPYAINEDQLKVMQELIKKNPNKIALLEYYLMRKTIPILILGGVIKKESFYFTTEGVLTADELLKESVNLSGKLREIIGDPLSVQVEILESKGDSGRLDHRGPHLFDIKRGGGMIHDLGLHAVVPLFALKSYLGDINESFQNGKVRIAQCREYSNLATRVHQLPEEYIAETYAEFNFSTSKNIPIKISVGKYILDKSGQKKIIIQGTKGKLYLDLFDNALYLYNEDGSKKKILELVNTKHSRYYPVIRSALEMLNGKNSYTLDSAQLVLDAQRFILNIVDKAHALNAIKIYEQNISHSEIFLHKKNSMFGKLDKLDKKDFQSYFSGYRDYLFDLMKKTDSNVLNKIAEIFMLTRKKGNTIYFIGNGGSAATASHFAQDLAEVGRKVKCKLFKSISLTDNTPAITASGNDYGYEKIFSSQMQGIFKKGDVLVAISASGNSPNIIEAVNFAKEKGGIVIGLVGFDGGKLLPISDYAIHVKAEKGEYGPVEDIHMIFDHLLTSFLYYKFKEEI